MSENAGDFAVGATVRLRFNTRKADGTPITLAGTPAVSIYKQGSTVESTAGVTLTTDYDSRTGYHSLSVDTSADGSFYAAGNDFFAAITAGTVDGVSVIGANVGRFSIRNRIVLADDRSGNAIPTAEQNAAATASQITTDHGSGSYIRNTEPDNSGIASAAESAASADSKGTTILSRIGAFTGSGVNTILGILKAIASKSATLPSDVGGTFDPATDSVEALRDRGDSGAWGANTTAIADALIAAVDETGLAVSSAKPAFLSQLAAAEIEIPTVSPALGRPLTIYRGCDHLDATGNAFPFRNPDGTWPDLTDCTVQLEVQVGEQIAAHAGEVVVATGSNQEVLCELPRNVLTNASVLAGHGKYRVIRVDASGNRYRLTGGIAMVDDAIAPT